MARSSTRTTARFERVDHAGIAAILRSAEVADTMNELAHDIAADTRASIPSPDVEADAVVVDDYTTDRAASSVTIRDVRGRLWEARDGVLSRAARSAGLEVRTR